MRVTLLELFLLRSGMINGNAVGDKMIEWMVSDISLVNRHIDEVLKWPPKNTTDNSI